MPARGRLPASARSHALVAGAADDAAAAVVVGSGAGDHHNAALRHLANTLLSKVWHCLQHQQAWNEHQAWPTRADQPAAAA